MTKIQASVEILTFNNEATLGETLESVAELDDVLILDGGSTDKTLEIARAAGARIFPQRDDGSAGPISDFAAVRNKGLSLAKYDWFFYLDSDELCTKELKDEIRSIIESEAEERFVWQVPRKYCIEGVVIDCATTYPNFQTRFFHRGHVEAFIKPVHERIKPKAGEAVGKTKHFMLIPLPSLTHSWKKWQQYLSIEEERLRGTNRRQILLKILHTKKAITAYGVRLLARPFCRGAKMPLSYEFARQQYNLRLLTILLKHLILR